tara:strand:+ start:567 stop:914 length:348 start_codon:yes stop_codon:yes gene_type:complete
MPEESYEFEDDMDPIADALIWILARRSGMPIPLRLIDAATDAMKPQKGRLPEHMRADPRVRRAYTKNKGKVKRKVSKYQKEFGKSMKILIKQHPRTKKTQLMKKAHRLTKRRMKK